MIATLRPLVGVSLRRPCAWRSPCPCSSPGPVTVTAADHDGSPVGHHPVRDWGPHSATVGLSTGITPNPAGGREVGVLIALMFAGRTGSMTVAAAPRCERSA